MECWVSTCYRPRVTASLCAIHAHQWPHERRRPRRRRAPGGAQAEIVGLLAEHGPLRLFEIETLRGTSRRTTSSTLTHLVASGRVRRLDRGLYEAVCAA